FFNAGEKIWYWIVILVGAVVTVSGFVLNFPIFDQGRELMQLALVVHGIAAVIVIAGSFGHIYIGTAGTEGSLDSMTTGTVDANWAKAHHDIWYEKLEAEGALDKTVDSGGERTPSMPSPDKA
ncbi:MAG: formate dehydrogenase subunit gamma, partial [Gammaproteobacteria bacterium]